MGCEQISSSHSVPLPCSQRREDTGALHPGSQAVGPPRTGAIVVGDSSEISVVSLSCVEMPLDYRDTRSAYVTSSLTEGPLLAQRTTLTSAQGCFADP